MSFAQGQTRVIYCVTFIVAFCSIVYELILGQLLSALLGNAVLRFSITIGLYMFSMGIGSFLAESRIVRRPVGSFLVIETLLALIGGLSVVALFQLENLIGGGVVFLVLSHGLIILIGILTGFEIPLLARLAGGESKRTNEVLGVDYLGAFLGTVLFAFLFYREVGLVLTAFVVALLNVLAALILAIMGFRGERSARLMFPVLLLCAFGLSYGAVHSESIAAYLSGLYVAR